MARSNADKMMDRSKLRFGKYKGQTPEEVARVDPTYVVWAQANILNPPVVSRELAQLCEDAVRDSDGEIMFDIDD
jgi:hypothetical protein